MVNIFVIVVYGPSGDGSSQTGLEDVAWIKCLKSLGTLPIVPLFQILHDYDLSNEDDDVSVLC